MLFDHFHDIMPGSGIGINYVDAERNLTDASLRTQKILDGALDSMDAIVDTRGAGIPVVVFNPLSWARTAPVTVETEAPPSGEQYEVRDANGQALPSQTISTDTAGRKVTLQIIAKDVPPMGYETLHLVAVAKPRTVRRGPEGQRDRDRKRVLAGQDRCADRMHHQPGE